MARISTYANDTNVVGADKWIGSDSQNNMETKNFTAQAVADFINKTGGQAQNLRYTYNDTTGYETGTLSFTNGGAANVLLSSITSINAGIYDQRSETLDISEFITGALDQSEILLTDCTDVSNWAIYAVTSAVKGANFLVSLNLTFKAGGGSLIANKDYFISLLKYDNIGGGDLNFTVGIPGNSLTYLITHNLNKFPAVSTFEDGTKKEIFGEVTYNNLNQCTLTFTSLFTGTATFN